MFERYEIIEVDNDARHNGPAPRRIVASNLSADNATATRERFRSNVPQGSSIEYRIRAT